MLAADQWMAIQERLGDSWETASLTFSAEDAKSASAAAGVLAPLGPGRVGTEVRFLVSRRGGGPQLARNLMTRLDKKRIWGTLELREQTATPVAAQAPSAQSLALAWDAEVAKLPPGWRDLFCELELDSTDYVPRAALLGAPLNPTRNPNAIALRFRVASSGNSYGASPGMTRRCFERMDAESITGRVTILHAISDTDNVATQGPVWRIAGRSV